MATERNVKFAITAEDRAAKVLAGVRASLGGVDSRVTALNNSFGKLAPLLGSAFAGASFTAFIKSNVDAIDRLNDLKDATGSSIENLSALENIGARTGTSFDSVSTSLVKFNKVLSDSKPGSDTAQLLKSLGLNAEELKKADPAEALQRTAIALQGFADDGNKARIIQELFGKSVKEAAPFLKDLAEAGKLQGTVTTQQAEEAEKFNKQLFALQKNSQDLARELTSRLVPAMNDFLVKLQGLRAADKDGQGGFWSSIGKEFKANLISDQLRVVTADIIKLDAYMQKNPGSPKLEIRMKQLREEASQLQRQAASASDALKGFSKVADPDGDSRPDYGNEGRARPKPSAAGGGGVGKETAQITAYQKLIDKIRERSALEKAEINQGAELAESDKLGLQLVLDIADARNKLTDAQKRNATAQLEGLLVTTKANEARAVEIKRLADVEQLNEKARSAFAQFMEGYAREGEARAQRNQQLAQELADMGLGTRALEDLRLARLEDAAAIEAQTLATAINAGERGLDIELRQRNLGLLREEIALQRQGVEVQRARREDPRAGVRAAVDSYLEDTQAMGRNLEQLTGRTIDGLEGATTRLLTGQKAGFRQLVDETLAEITRLYVVKPFLASLFSGGKSSTGGSGLDWGSLVGSILGYFSSGMATNNTGTSLPTSGGRAEGGPVMARRAYMVGERGPELLLTGSDAGRVLPNSASMGGSVTVVQNLNIGAGVNPSQLAQAMRQAKDQAKAEIAEQMRRGSRAYS